MDRETAISYWSRRRRRRGSSWAKAGDDAEPARLRDPGLALWAASITTETFVAAEAVDAARYGAVADR